MVNKRIEILFMSLKISEFNYFVQGEILSTSKEFFRDDQLTISNFLFFIFQLNIFFYLSMNLSFRIHKCLLNK